MCFTVPPQCMVSTAAYASLLAFKRTALVAQRDVLAAERAVTELRRQKVADMERMKAVLSRLRRGN